MKDTFALAFCVFAMVSVAPASVIIYSTDGTNTPGYRTNSMWGAGAGYNPSIDMQFTAGATASLSSITVAASYPGFTTMFKPATDNAGAPGSILDTISIVGTGAAGEHTGSSTNNPVLTAGTAYWLEMVPPSGGTAYWFVSVPGVSGNVSDGNGTFFTNGGLGAFALEGAPEPGTMMLLATGIVGLVGRKVLRAFR